MDGVFFFCGFFGFPLRGGRFASLLFFHCCLWWPPSFYVFFWILRLNIGYFFFVISPFVVGWNFVYRAFLVSLSPLYWTGLISGGLTFCITFFLVCFKTSFGVF